MFLLLGCDFVFSAPKRDRRNRVTWRPENAVQRLEVVSGQEPYRKRIAPLNRHRWHPKGRSKVEEMRTPIWVMELRTHRSRACVVSLREKYGPDVRGSNWLMIYDRIFGRSSQNEGRLGQAWGITSSHNHV